MPTMFEYIIINLGDFMTELQLAAIISQALYAGSVYGERRHDEDFDERDYRNYTRGMLNIILKTVCHENERAVERALEDFLNGFDI